MEEPLRFNIKCPIFLESDAVIKNVISKFLKASSKEKRYYAQDILTEIHWLLSCAKYNNHNADCINCHAFAKSQRNNFPLGIKRPKIDLIDLERK